MTQFLSFTDLSPAAQQVAVASVIKLENMFLDGDKFQYRHKLPNRKPIAYMTKMAARIKRMRDDIWFTRLMIVNNHMVFNADGHVYSFVKKMFVPA